MILVFGLLAGCGQSSKNAAGDAEQKCGPREFAGNCRNGFSKRRTDIGGQWIGRRYRADIGGDADYRFGFGSRLLSRPASSVSKKEELMIIDCMAETLFKWDAKSGEIVPRLADFEWIDDTHFRVTLKDGIYFQNGEELTTDDVTLYIPGKKLVKWRQL